MEVRQRQHYISQSRLSTHNLSQWTHFGLWLSSDRGSNIASLVLVVSHKRWRAQCRSMTATPTAHASPARNSDSVYLWDPSHYGITSRTKSGCALRSCSLPRRLSRQLAPQVKHPFQPRRVSGTGSSNSTTIAARCRGCAREYANVAFDVKTDIVFRAVSSEHRNCAWPSVSWRR